MPSYNKQMGNLPFFQSTVTASSRLKLCLVVGVCALASAPGLAGAKSLDPEQPNLLLILVDDMGWPSLSVQMDPDNPDSRSDYHQTPNLETLAQQGMVFSNGYAAGPMCSPSRVAVQTGATPAGLRVTDLRQAANNSHGWYSAWYNGRPLTPPQPRNLFWESNIAGVLEQIDPSYNTGWFGKWDWWPQPTDTGYDSANDNDPRVNSPPEDPKGIFSLTQLATNFLDDNDQNDDPFFLLISHDAPKGNGEAKQATLDEFEALPVGVKHRVPAYAAMHKDLDEGIGTVLNRLDSMGVADNTYVMLTSDHGAAIGLQNHEIINSPLYGGKGTLWEGGVRVPMIVRGPGITASSHSSVPVSGIDILPTFHDLAGGTTSALPDRVEGASITPLLFNSGTLPEGVDAIQRPHAKNGELYFHYPHYNNTTVPPGDPQTPTSTVRDGDYKLVRIYGQNGDPNELLLFNLADNLEESIDPSSPLNLASAMPDKVAELNTKLTKWLQAVDASLPYDVRSPVQLDWVADHPGSAIPGRDVPELGWRSIQDVDYFDREVWAAAAGVEPTRTTIEPHQPGLGDHAYHFNGAQGFARRYIHVSDSRYPDTIDADHSASFEFWLRLDSMTNEQLVFEAGKSTMGLSLTLGDADGDNSENDLRFRVLGSGGHQLSVTVPIDQFADPVADFVHVAAVINDSTENRYVELYVNGALAGHVDGTTGTTEINWDDHHLASLGAVRTSDWQGDTLGAATGSGDLPFAGGNLRGSIAAFRIENYAVTPQQVLESYNEKLDPVGFGVTAVEDGASLVAERPSSVASGALEETMAAVVLLERRDNLDNDLPVDLLVATDAAGILPAGSRVASYLIHFDPTGEPSSSTSVSGSLTFAGEILGVLSEDGPLATTDALLGAVGEYATGSRSGDFLGDDFFNVSENHQMLDFMLSAQGNGVAQLRVLTSIVLSGDFNADGIVDAADYTTWQDNIGAPAGTLPNDIDGGVIGLPQYNTWKSNFGLSEPSFESSALAIVPEPTSGLLIMLGIGIAGLRTRVSSRRFSRTWSQ